MSKSLYVALVLIVSLQAWGEVEQHEATPRTGVLQDRNQGSDSSATWQSRLRELEKRMDALIDREVEAQRTKGLVGRIGALASQVGVKVEGALITQIEKLEKDLGRTEPASGSLLARVEVLEFLANKRLQEVREKSRVDSKAKERLATLEKFLADRLKADPLSSLPREERLQTVLKLKPLPNLTKQTPPMRILEAYERDLALIPNADDAFDARLQNVEKTLAAATQSLDQWFIRAALRFRALE